MVSERKLDWEANSRPGGRIGNRHPRFAPQGCYRCAGEHEWCVISVRDDEEWSALCRVFGRPELARDARFASEAGRRAHHDELDKIIGAWTATREKYEVMEAVQGAGVPAGAVFDARDLHLDPHLRSRRFLETVRFPPERGIATRQIIGRPWRLDKTPLSVRGPGPSLGEHNREILQRVLGYSDAQCAELEAEGIIGTRPTKARPVVHLDMDEHVRLGRLGYWDPAFKDRLADFD